GAPTAGEPGSARTGLSPHQRNACVDNAMEGGHTMVTLLRRTSGAVIQPWVIALASLTALVITTLWPPGVREAAAFTLKCGTATINDVQHEFCKRYIARLAEHSQGAIQGQVFPASQLGS